MIPPFSRDITPRASEKHRRFIAPATPPGQAFRIGSAWGVQFHPEVDRDIVVAWSGPADPQGRYVAEFAAAEAAHRLLARRLLDNFLAFSGIA